MFLKSLELYGFKSFADKTRLEFANGTTSLLGPNGCGKSNIVDAIKWVLGEQSTKTLRAGKMEDVIFNGTQTRKALHVAEVTLVINNEEGLLPQEHTEIEIKRRIHRSGESEFFINRAPVRLRDIRELFFDTGVGKSAYSILEQGKIDQILSHKPEDRRYIFEEAAGITRFKQKSIEATRKLERTEENIEQVQTLLSEIKRQYDQRKAQATKAQRYRDLERELTEIEVDVAISTVQSFLLLKEKRNQELLHAKDSYDELKERIAAKTAYLEEEQSALRQKNQVKIEIQTRLQRLEEQLRGKEEQLTLLKQRYKDFQKNYDQAKQRAQHILERIDRDHIELEEQRTLGEVLTEKIDSIQERIKEHNAMMDSTQTLISSIEKEILEREEAIVECEQTQQIYAKKLQELTDELVAQLDQKLSESGYSTKARLGASHAMSQQFNRMLQRLTQRMNLLREGEQFDEDLRKDLIHQIVEQKKFIADILSNTEQAKSLFEAYEKTVPSFIDELLAPQGIITRKHAIDSALEETQRSALAHRESVSLLKEERKGLNQLVDQYREQLTQMKIRIGELTSNVEHTKKMIENLQRSITEQKYLHQDADNDAEVALSRIEESTNQMAQVRDDQHTIVQEQESLEGELQSISIAIEEETERLNGERMLLNQLYEELSTVRGSIDKFTFHLESLHEQIQQVYRNFFDSYGKSLKEYEERLEREHLDTKDLRERLIEIKKQMQGMGYINHMAQQEFEEIKERYEFLSHQMDDLVRAKGDLVRVIDEITRRSEELFLNSYHNIRTNFQEMFHRMFGGGRAELRLTNPEAVLESGIDILAQPPGKKLDRLAPLSGGEKALTAVALLFATYKVKPSPFCILDEIDAALDDRNIGYFLGVLQDFSATSQFIIITHNKHTVMGSQTLLGVTMEEKGVSKAISIRMGYDAQNDIIEEPQVDNDLDNTV